MTQKMAKRYGLGVWQCGKPCAVTKMVGQSVLLRQKAFMFERNDGRTHK